MIPLGQLMAKVRPPTAQVDAFYDESERLVRFLVRTDKPRFLQLLDALSARDTFDNAFARVYAGIFASRADFEEKFRDYVSKDAATTLPDQ